MSAPGQMFSQVINRVSRRQMSTNTPGSHLQKDLKSKGDAEQSRWIREHEKQQYQSKHPTKTTPINKPNLPPTKPKDECVIL